ncbi:MAG TPA: bifunctional anthranilate synthase component I family protein/class IV aminotransferase [Woeseiaceae bacterium]|nr:bifunctional anthranilate synthase component I family protein/class IV aminotransferase [Woeseiaceae bacterium]
MTHTANLKRVVMRDAETGDWLSYDEPVAELAASTPEDLVPLLQGVRRRVDEEGVTAVGYLAYEAAPAFDASLAVRQGFRWPLAAFGLFRRAHRLESLPAAPQVTAAAWRVTTDRLRYADAIECIRGEIALGNCYQVNYTIRKETDGVADPWLLFLAIGRDAPYGAYLEFADFAIVSASPELFFALHGTRIVCRPMKGTARRGLTSAADDEAASALIASAKDRAENVMIADMVRNDLGRIARPGSVRATSLYTLEKYPTVWQLTSTVEAVTEAPVDAVLAALFPCASITGAPKAAAMRLISRLEQLPREVYTGAIGRIEPHRRAVFSVAIRTALVDRRDGSATYGIGGGIVWDSDADAEYRECLAKARLLAAAPAPAADFALLETLRWSTEEGWYLEDLHRQRLAGSARYFDIPLDEAAVTAALAEATAGFGSATMRVRLLVTRDGGVRVEASPLVPQALPVRLRLAMRPVDDQDPFLYHKTTNRAVYESALAEAGDCDDVVLWNASGCVTETTRANLVVRLGGQDFTPPVASGLLPGTCRQWLLAHTDLREREIRIEELATADGIALFNSVRGRMPARLDAAPAPSETRFIPDSGPTS